MKKYIVLGFIFYVSGLFAQQSSISKPLQFRLPVEVYVRNYVEPRLKTWVKWDRYEESSTQYKERVSEENRAAKISQWEQEALEIYKKKYAETVDWNQFQLEGEYDPDNECFLIASSQFGKFTVKVPRGKSARTFATKFDSVKVKQPDFYFSKDAIELDKLTFVLPSGEEFIYDSKIPHKYAALNIVYNEGLSLDQFNFNYEVRERQEIERSLSALSPSDVDIQIPSADKINMNVYAVVIGNENYHYESPTRFSANDANVFYQYCKQTLGIPEKNIFMKVDATYGDMLKSIQFLKDAAKAKNSNIRIIYYYSGHGMSDIKTNGMHLLPVDGSSMTLQAALKAETLYKELAEMKTLSATVFLDACFSGKTSEGVLAALLDGAGIEITPRKESLNGNIVVFSATSDAEIAYPYEEKNHRLFTYFLLKKMQETKGNVKFIDLANYLHNQVKLHAFDVNRKMQTPRVQTSYNITDVWKNWKLTE